MQNLLNAAANLRGVLTSLHGLSQKLFNFRVALTNRSDLSLAKTLGVLSFAPLTMLQACAQAVDFKVGHHFGEGQPGVKYIFHPNLFVRYEMEVSCECG